MLSRWDIINYHMGRVHRQDYLEIGCALNECFDKVKNKGQKVGVDPKSGGTLRMTSDDFFKVNLIKFDIIFIDGLHEHDQVWRDFQNARKFLRKGGYIFLHDLLPPEERNAIFPFDENSKKPRCGSSWRVIFDILNLDKQFHIIDMETGIGVYKEKDVMQSVKENSKTISFNKFIKLDLPIINTTEVLLLTL